jgi:adenylate cyclase
LVQSVKHTVAAKVVRAYLASMARLVRASGGAVRSFDGDRVMGVFVGKTKNTQATDCALKMNYVVTKLLKPQVESRLPSLVDAGYKLRHCVGVACSPLLVVRGGVRNANDLVFIGDAANIAAKLSEIRNPPWFSYVTEDVYKLIANSSKFSKDKTDMWTNVTRSDIADQKMRLYKSSWRRRP